MNLVLIDFDGTITCDDRYTPFLRYAVKGHRKLWGNLLLAPIYACYKLGWVSSKTMRIIASYIAFRGRAHQEVSALGQTYAQEVIPAFLRKDMQQRIHWHKQRGDHLVVVSASLDLYLKPWCDTHKLELICSQMAVKHGKLTGMYTHGDCSGPAKAANVRARYNLHQFSRIYAYGDTAEDNELLALADEKYMQGKHIE